MKIGIIGGGNIGGALARMASAAGHEVTMGLRNPAAATGDWTVTTMDAAITGADLVVLALPYRALAEALPPLAPALRGKVVIDPSNALNPDLSPMALPDGTSAAEIIAGMLPGAQVVKAFNTIFAANFAPKRLERAGHRLAVFLAGDDKAAVARVADFVASLGFKPVARHTLTAARQIEAMGLLVIALGYVEGLGDASAYLFSEA